MKKYLKNICTLFFLLVFAFSNKASAVPSSSDYTIQSYDIDIVVNEDNTFDMALLFGPMYHLFTFEDKLKALNEAKRVVKPGGIILVAYLMNEYSVITYAFKEGHINECLNGNRLTEDYHTVSSEENLYDYMRIEDINSLNEAAGLERIKILSPDGPANYIRPYLNKLTEEEFAEFVKYHLATCERQDLIGAAAHTLDILRVK